VPEPQKDFFVSYNKADRAWAEWIAWQLENAGYTTVIQAWDFGTGSNFVLEMQRALTEAARMMAVFSPDYLSALFTQAEWAAVFVNDPTGEKRLLLPFMVRECEPTGLLKPIVHTKLCGLDEGAARKALLAGIDHGRTKPSTAPAFPGGAKPTFPGALPPIWRMPHTRNPNFTGREKLLKALYSDLHSGKPAALTQAIAGLGGVGKTQLSVEYAYRHAGEYEAVWWIQSEDPTALARDYAALAAEYGLPEKDAKEQPLIVAAVKRNLEHAHNWLLIFDNAEVPDSIRSYLPSSTTGHIIITSRSKNWSQIGQVLDVPTFDPKESAKYLLGRTGQKDGKSAEALADELGHLPLALAQAAAFISETGMSLAEYLKCFQTRRSELWSAERGPIDHKDTVHATLGLAIDRVGTEYPAALDLLNLCAFLAPDDIPLLLLLSTGKECLPETLLALAENAVERAKCIAVLKKYSLADIEEGLLSFHRMTQAVLQDRLADGESAKWVGLGLKIIDAAFPENSQYSLDSWPVCAKLLPHARAALTRADGLGLEFENMTRLLNQMAIYLIVRADLAEARVLMERALAIDQEALGADHLLVALRLGNLASVIRGLGSPDGAKPLAARALAITEKALGEDHPDVAVRLNNLAAIHYDLGDLVAAKVLAERALLIDKKALGENHLNVARDSSNLAMILKRLGDLKSAKPLVEHALVVTEKALGRDHPHVATCASNLAGFLRDLGDLKGAKELFERALAIDEEAFGEDHPEVATDLSNIAAVLMDLDDVKSASARCEQALRIARSVLGDDHPHTKIYVANLEIIGRRLRAQHGQ